MEFKDLIRTLADEVGFEDGLVPDEDGVVRIASEKTTGIAFMEVPESRSLVMWSRIGELPVHGTEGLKDALLKANFMGQATVGGALSLSEDGGIYFHRMLQLDQTDGDGFMEAVTAFVQASVNLNRLITENAYQAAVRPDEPSEWGRAEGMELPPPDFTAIPGLGNPNFIQV